MQLTGYGIRTATLQRYASIQPQSLPYIAMSEALHLRSWPVFTKALEKKKVYLYGSKIAPDHMPRHWRGYAGLWKLLITVEEWDGLPAEVRRAVVDWVLMGGELNLLHRHHLPHDSRDYGGFRFEGIAEQKATGKQLGLGRVSLHTWDGQELSLGHLESLQDQAKRKEKRLALYERPDRSYERQTWSLMDRIPTKRFSQAFVWVLSAFLLCYFVLIGPYNVWRSVKRGKRLQLFFTTPLLAITSSVILCVLLALRVGFGASGFRTTWVYLLPNQPKAMVLQEQITKTAFMPKTT